MNFVNQKNNFTEVIGSQMCIYMYADTETQRAKKLFAKGSRIANDKEKIFLNISDKKFAINK